MLTIREAQNKDLASINEVIGKVLDELGMKLDPDGIDADLADIDSNYQRQGGLFVVVEDEQGQIAGSAGLMRVDARQCELRKMYFLPEIRGQGAGKSLLDFMVKSAGKLGFEEIHLETNKSFHTAIALYRMVGFEPKEREGSCDLRCDRAFYLDLDRYEKPNCLKPLNVTI